MSYIFTSESVSEGHPDKLCDQISDAILDLALSHDPDCRVAAECFATTGLVVVGGEMSSSIPSLDIQEIVRKTIREIGYTHPDYGLDVEGCTVLNSIHQQSNDIAQGVIEGQGLDKGMGAGDQGMMFGYACKQTDTYMPLPIHLSHSLMRELARIRKSKELDYLRPDAKSQVSVEYTEDHQPIRVDTVVISTQHHPEIDHAQIEVDMISNLIKRVIPSTLLDDQTRYLINPTGRFVTGGPHGDAGLTGRKIIVDTYGGWANHGGGAFSGKDCTKVDRSGAYMARYVAKNLVAANLAEEAEVQLAYAIGFSQPVSVRVNTKGTGKLPDAQLTTLVKDVFDLSPSGIIDTLDLKRPIYQPTAAYGHFGRDDLNVGWEQLNQVDPLLSKAQLKQH